MTNIYEAIEYWHTNEVIPPVSLHEYLGMTWKDYKKWGEGLMTDAELSGFGYSDD